MTCKNCEEMLTKNSSYCNQCGAKVITQRLTIRNAWEDFSERFFNVDNTFYRTFSHLFTKPTQVIGSYIHGVRKKYMNVFSYFAIALTLSGFQIFVVRKFFPEAMEIPFTNFGSYPDNYQDTVNSIYDYTSLLVLINLPIYALVGWLTFIGTKKYNYAEHFVIMTYIFSQYSIVSMPVIVISTMLGANYYMLGYILFIPLFVYTVLIYKKLYQLSFGQVIIRGIVLVGIIMSILILLGLIQFAVLLITGDFQQMMEAEKAKRSVSYMASSAINWTSYKLR